MRPPDRLGGLTSGGTRRLASPWRPVLPVLPLWLLVGLGPAGPGGCKAPPPPPAPVSCSDLLPEAALLLHAGELPEAVARLSGQARCPAEELLRGFALVALEREEEGVPVLERLAREDTGDRVTSRLAGELHALAVIRPDGRGLGEAREVARATLQRHPDSVRSRLLLALLGPATATVETRALLLPLAQPLPRLADPQDLALKELAAVLAELLSGGRDLPAASSSATRLALARFLGEQAGRRAGLAFRQLAERARGEAQAVLTREPAWREQAVLLYGTYSLELRDFPAAAAAARAHLQVQPGALAVRELLLDALALQGEHEALLAEAKGIPLGVCPSCHLQVAAALQRLGRGGEGVALLRDLHRAQPGEPHVLRALGQALLQQGELTAAWPLLEQATAALPRDPAAAGALAAVLARLGQEEQAREAGERYRAIAQQIEEEGKRPGNLRTNLASRYAEALRALEQGKLATAQHLAAGIGQRDPAYPLLPLLRLALAGKKGEPLREGDFDELLRAARASNAWLPRNSP
ncbi:MAG: hypothetical protein RBU45_24445 [Myxococcota bacterium]|nr:hypothetical protein [Myxococcota bacterium]